MAGLGMAILGGAFEQVGTGIADRGKALREEKLKQLSQEREFQFRSQMADKEIGARTAGNQQQQTFTAGENAKSRQTQMDVANIRTSNTSTNVADADWLVANGIAPDKKTAYEKVTQAAGDKTAKARMVIDVAKTMQTNMEPIPGNDSPTFADYQAAATTQVDALIQSTAGGGAPTDPYAGDRTAPEGPSNVIKSKPGALRAPPGDGTQDRPFKAAKQADVDWFKQYAKPGDMIEYGGTIYTK